MVLIQSNSAQDFESLVRLHQWRQAENTWVLWKTRAKNVRKQVDIALILSASNQSTHKEFSVPLEFFEHRQRRKKWNSKFSPCANTEDCYFKYWDFKRQLFPPSNSNSDNSFFSQNGISESLNSNMLQVYQAKRCPNQGLERWNPWVSAYFLPKNHCFTGS